MNQTSSPIPSAHLAEEGWLEHSGLSFCHRIIRHPAPTFAPTLFVSGAFQTMDSWSRFARAFIPHTTVLLVDPPGMGASDVLPPDVGVDALAGCLEEIARVHALERLNVIAASYGTPAAYRLCQRRPDLVQRVALAGTMKEIPRHMRQKVQASAETALRGDRVLLADQVVEGMLCRDLRLPVERRELAERVLRAGISRMSDRELEQFAANTNRLLHHTYLDTRETIVGPEALVFTGEHDCFTTPADCLEIARAFRHAWFTLIDRTDHLFHLERFDTVLDLLLTFMKGSSTVEGRPGNLTWVGAGPRP